MSENTSSGLTALERVIGLVLTVMTTFAAYQASVTKDQLAEQALKLDHLKLQVAEAAEERETRKLNHEITIKIFDEVKSIYSDENITPDRQLNRLLAVSALIEAVPDSAVRGSLAASVRTAADNVSAMQAITNHQVSSRIATVQSKLDESVFKAEQSDLTRTAPVDASALTEAAQRSTAEKPRWEGYDLDFFWCEVGTDPEGARRAAELAASLRHLDPSASGRWRVRKLPAAINERLTYRLNTHQISVSSEDEKRIAAVLVKLMEGQGLPGLGGKWEIVSSGASTPWYLSVFFCSGAHPG